MWPVILIPFLIAGGLWTGQRVKHYREIQRIEARFMVVPDTADNTGKEPR